MSAFEERKAEENKAADSPLPSTDDHVKEIKTKRKTVERKPRARKEKTLGDALSQVVDEVVPLVEPVAEPVAEPLAEALPKKKFARKPKSKVITTSPAEVDQVVVAMC